MIIIINLSISTLEQRCFKVFYDDYFMNLSIFILHNVVSSFAQRFNYWPRLTQS